MKNNLHTHEKNNEEFFNFVIESLMFIKKQKVIADAIYYYTPFFSDYEKYNFLDQAIDPYNINQTYFQLIVLLKKHKSTTAAEYLEKKLKKIKIEYV